MRRDLALFSLALTATACPVGPPNSIGSSTGNPPIVCQASTQAATLYSGECPPPQQSTTFCLFTVDTDF